MGKQGKIRPMNTTSLKKRQGEALGRLDNHTLMMMGAMSIHEFSFVKICEF
jgi:hypothetical protein